MQVKRQVGSAESVTNAAMLSKHGSSEDVATPRNANVTVRLGHCTVEGRRVVIW